VNKLEKIAASISGLGAFLVLAVFSGREIIEYLEKERIRKEGSFCTFRC